MKKTCIVCNQTFFTEDDSKQICNRCKSYIDNSNEIRESRAVKNPLSDRNPKAFQPNLDYDDAKNVNESNYKQVDNNNDSVYPGTSIDSKGKIDVPISHDEIKFDSSNLPINNNKFIDRFRDL